MRTKMVKVILDSNFLFVPFQFKVDIFGELERLFGKVEPVVLSTTVEELRQLKAKKSPKLRSQINAAIKLIEKCQSAVIEKRRDESFDDIILRTAKEWNCPVCTNDANLRKRLREAGVTVVFLRQKSHLEIEGGLP
jgi:rRNA-processing protein FCF1